MNIKKLPKIELHCHLDGSVRPQTIIDIAKQDNIPLDSYSIEDVTKAMIAPQECKNLDEYLQRFDLPLKIMQTSESLSRVAYELMEDCMNNNIKYIEVRFGPMLHNRRELTTEEVISAVLEGLRRGEKDFGVKSNLILSCLRHHTIESVYEVIEAGLPYLNKGVVAIDLAGSELADFVHRYVDAIKYAKDKGYRVTIHAGETGIGQNVWDAVTLLGAERIGHGVYILNHRDAYDIVKKNRITLEMCPTSNVQTKAVESVKAHPVMDFYNDDVLVTINTDNTTVSDTDMSKEIRLLADELNMGDEDYKKIYLNSVNAAFCDSETKEYLRKLI